MPHHAGEQNLRHQKLDLYLVALPTKKLKLSLWESTARIQLQKLRQRANAITLSTDFIHKVGSLLNSWCFSIDFRCENLTDPRR